MGCEMLFAVTIPKISTIATLILAIMMTVLLNVSIEANASAVSIFATSPPSRDGMYRHTAMIGSDL